MSEGTFSHVEAHILEQRYGQHITKACLCKRSSYMT